MNPSAPIWITMEGVNGVGKTHLLGRIAARLGDQCLVVDELPDQHTAVLPRAVIAALGSGGDPFLRTGHPRTETLLLAALQVHRHETLRQTVDFRVVLEDRGPLTVAVYQAAILAEAGQSDDAFEMASGIYSTILAWRPAPTVTLLLRDDPAQCRQRFEQRLRRMITPDEHSLMTRADHLYQRFADADPAGFRIIDRREFTAAQAADAIVETCHMALESDPCDGETRCPITP